MSKNNGGPAFPVPNLQDDEDFNGMTMRDYFAAKAMQGIMAGILGDGGDWPNREIIVANAYATADSMLAERAK
ncbi:hypothetical protein [Pseudomonas sp.]|uniref:hypothetical protein n=1 Tax=Pseudomonas sp. TaxID=306 RepID=UPI003FD7512A